MTDEYHRRSNAGKFPDEVREFTPSMEHNEKMTKGQKKMEKATKGSPAMEMVEHGRDKSRRALEEMGELAA